MTDVLVFGDTLRSPELRHEVPLPVPDPFLYAEHDGVRYAAVHSLEVSRLRELGGLEVIPYAELGWDELVRSGIDRQELHLPLAVRACERLGIRSAAVPAGFPLDLADRLRAAGVELHVDRALFAGRRRVKTPFELAGIARAQRAAEAAMDVVRDLLRRAEGAGALEVDGEPLTSERAKQAIGAVFAAHEAVADEFIVSHGPQTATGHEMGFGTLAAGEPIIVDLFLKDRATGCYADMTRTFVVGEPPEELVRYHALCLQALEEALARIRPGVTGRALFDGTCELFERHGFTTDRTKAEGAVLDEGFIHSLGHGVGLEVHEEPSLGTSGLRELVAGDVIAVEPGLYRPGFGGCRLEDLVRVTEDGAENLTTYPYDLAP